MLSTIGSHNLFETGGKMEALAHQSNNLRNTSIHLSCMPKKDANLLKLSMPCNESGILYRVAAVLFTHGWDILEAIAETSPEGYVQDVFVVKSQTKGTMTEAQFKSIRSDLNLLFCSKLDVKDYLLERGISQEYLNSVSDPHAVVRLYNPISGDLTVMDVRMKDRPGILLQITQTLQEFEIDIVTFSAISDQGLIRDSFLIRDRNGNKLEESTIVPKLKSAIESIL